MRRNTVLIGTRDMLETNYLQGWPANWLSRELADCAAAGERHKLRCEVQVRAHAAPVPCTVEMMGETVTIHTDVPLRGVACGQSAVLYQPDPVGDLVLGSATIHATAESYDTLTAQDSTERPVSSPLSGVSESS